MCLYSLAISTITKKIVVARLLILEYANIFADSIFAYGSSYKLQLLFPQFAENIAISSNVCMLGRFFRRLLGQPVQDALYKFF